MSEQASKWEAVIGLEVHVQLNTASKLFSSAPTRFGAEPNAQASYVDLGLPGTLPVLNQQAIACAIRFGLAVDGDIAEVMEFDRKNYFYPDLPKGYQISQLAQPAVDGGLLCIDTDAGERQIRLTRAHLEEDAGKSLHEDFAGRTGIDLNRAGTPLLEIVSEPDLRSAAEAGAYMRKLHALVCWIGICDGQMAEGSLRCDANVSLRPRGTEPLGERCEIKNVNSFRFVEKAIEYEIQRQTELLDAGATIERATLLYDEKTGTTQPMRGKEMSEDYRYFPDPDLLPVRVKSQWVEAERATLPELPDAASARLQQSLGLSAYDANLLTTDRDTLAYFETAAQDAGDAQLACNWINGELAALRKDAAVALGDCPVSAPALGGLLRRIADGTISGTAGKQVLIGIWNGDGDADSIIEARGLKQISDSGELQELIAQVLADNASQAQEYRDGKEKVFGYLVGQVMKASRGKANPAQASELLKKLLRQDA